MNPLPRGRVRDNEVGVANVSQVSKFQPNLVIVIPYSMIMHLADKKTIDIFFIMHATWLGNLLNYWLQGVGGMISAQRRPGQVDRTGFQWWHGSALGPGSLPGLCSPGRCSASLSLQVLRPLSPPQQGQGFGEVIRGLLSLQSPSGDAPASALLLTM